MLTSSMPVADSPLLGADTTPGSDTVMRCFNEIANAIRERRYRPDQRLGESTLSEELGYGRAHVRAALDKLAHHGVVERRPRSGTYVRRLTVRQYIELAEVRSVLEGYAARVACTTLNNESLEELSRLADRLDTATHDDHEPWDHLMQLESEFHTRIAEAGGNQALLDIVARHNFLSRHLTEGRLIKLPTLVFFGVDESQSEHRRIADALGRRDLDEAEREVRNHVLLSLYVQIRLFLRLPDTEIADDDRAFARQWLKNATQFLKAGSSVLSV